MDSLSTLLVPSLERLGPDRAPASLPKDRRAGARLVTDFYAYDTSVSARPARGSAAISWAWHWVGDLLSWNASCKWRAPQARRFRPGSREACIFAAIWIARPGGAHLEIEGPTRLSNRPAKDFGPPGRHAPRGLRQHRQAVVLCGSTDRRDSVATGLRARSTNDRPRFDRRRSPGTWRRPASVRSRAGLRGQAFCGCGAHLYYIAAKTGPVSDYPQHSGLHRHELSINCSRFWSNAGRVGAGRRPGSPSTRRREATSASKPHQFFHAGRQKPG